MNLAHSVVYTVGWVCIQSVKIIAPTIPKGSSLQHLLETQLNLE